MLSIKNAGGLCSAGTLRQTARRVEKGEALDALLSGRCAEAPLKELTELMPGKSLRRVPRLAKIALRAALEATEALPAPEALVLCTAYGSVKSTFEFMDSIIDDGPHLASPTAFSHSVTNMCAAYLSQGLKLRGPLITLTQPGFLETVEVAELLVASGQAASVLWGMFSEDVKTMTDIEKLAGRKCPKFNDGAVFIYFGRPGPDQKGVEPGLANGLETGSIPRPKHRPSSMAEAFSFALNCLEGGREPR